MIKRYQLLILLFICSGCTGNRSLAPSSESSSAKQPQRIVSLAPGCTEILFELGLAPKIVAVTSQCNWPPEAADKPKIGDVSTSKDMVLAQKPDLVIAHGFINREAVASLKALKVPVVAVDPKTLEEVARSVETIATACGVTESGHKIARQMRTVFNDADRTSNPLGYKALFIIQAEPLWAAGPDTFVGEMINKCGGKNVFNQPGAGFAQFSQEAAISANPDFIFVTDEASLKFVKSAAAWKRTSAYKNNRIIRVNPDIYLRPGPRLTQGLQEMSRLLSYR